MDKSPKRERTPRIIDSDYDWLKSRLTFTGRIESRAAPALAVSLRAKIAKGQVPHTLGVFGGWGTGKTTFLALLAEDPETPEICNIVYFNSWKNAGFMEIVPTIPRFTWLSDNERGKRANYRPARRSR